MAPITNQSNDFTQYNDLEPLERSVYTDVSYGKTNNRQLTSSLRRELIVLILTPFQGMNPSFLVTLRVINEFKYLFFEI